ncbi:hypothetical protein F511_32766 [Dorcoceras hygrometricum]|uniref:Uncharacterized protein n=1 Tax=Dorcoceras hygrometricum TaxID=472368 RepID=A0A2Z7DDC0_9LAMI|nr:hypothetical protein F511_32766 [Dorcoceras hygrometricum]
MQHAIINAMKCMRAIKDRIARPVYHLANHNNQPLYPHGVSTGEIIGTTHLLSSHNVAINQVINQSVNQAQDIYKGMAQTIEASQLPSATAITAGKELAANTKLRMAGNPYPEVEIRGRTTEFHCTKKTATSRSSPRSFYSLNWVTIGRATHKESSATKIAQNNGGERRQWTGKELR